MTETLQKLLRAIAVLLGVFVSKIISTHDVTKSMYMYLANHFTPQECRRLTAHLYAGGMDLAAVEELEQELPLDEPCLSLLMTWDSGDGKDKSFLNVADSLRKINRDQLAEWLSDTVYTELSKELNDCFLKNTTHISTVTVSTHIHKSIRPKLKTDGCLSDESLFFLIFDTFCMYFILMIIVSSALYLLNLLVDVFKETRYILNKENKEYTILEEGILPQDLDPKDEILDPFI